jgi:hypothetical protein
VNFEAGAPTTLTTAMSLLGASDDLPFVLGLIGQSHSEVVAAFEDVEVCHDVAVRVPHETGPRALLNLQHVEREEVLPDRDVGDVNDRGGGSPEDLYDTSLVGGEISDDLRRRRRRWHESCGAGCQLFRWGRGG